MKIYVTQTTAIYIYNCDILETQKVVQDALEDISNYCDQAQIIALWPTSLTNWKKWHPPPDSSVKNLRVHLVRTLSWKYHIGEQRLPPE